MFNELGITDELAKLARQAEIDLQKRFDEFEEICLYNSAKVLKAFHNARLTCTDFCETTGYGYYDNGRNKLEQVYCDIFKAEDALVRPQIMSGTHALSITFFGLLKYGDTFLSITGEPYDSLKGIIGLTGDSRNSLKAHGVNFEQIELKNDDFDIPAILERLAKGGVKLVEIQRSRGYSNRLSLSIDKIERVCTAIKERFPGVIIMVDNCYGDLVEKKEPTEVGADILVGSLLKNLGAGQARTGGYIVGKKELIWDISERFSAPCVGKDIGCNLNQLMAFFKGVYHAPSVVCASLKTMAFASYMLEKLGYDVSPRYDEPRADIVQTVNLHTADELIEFCRGIQKGVAIENYVTLIPSEMPGYPHEEIMASGSFVSGSTIELSCDGPIAPPFTAFMQGSLTYEYGKLGILISLSHLLKEKGIQLPRK